MCRSWPAASGEARHEITGGESAEYLRKAIRGLMANFAISDVSILALDRFRLRDEIEKRIQQHRDSERKVAFQAFLLPESMLVVGEERSINFMTMSYEPSWLYEGGFQFKKHYFGPKPGELEELTQSGKLKEEFQCLILSASSLMGGHWSWSTKARTATTMRIRKKKGR